MSDMLKTVREVLSCEPKFVAEDGQLLRNVLRAAALELDDTLLELLIDNAETRKHFFRPIKSQLMFDAKKFINFINLREFLPNSFTAYKNKIGLVDERGDFISAGRSIALAFPYKDCVLEGGQTKDDQKRREVFFNEVLAPDEIDRLLEPKVLVNAKRYSPNSVEIATDFRADDNLIVKGNNLLALSTLLPRFESKVKLIYIDPPYNTGNDSFGYNDRFNHSTWLVFMKNRLEIARRLLSKDGAIFIQLDDNEAHYLKVLADDLFGRENFVSTVVWEKKYSPQNAVQWLSDSHDFILVYAKDKEVWRPNLLPRTSEMDARYKNPDNDPRGRWKSTDATAQAGHGTPSQFYVLHAPNGRDYELPSGRCWLYTEPRMMEMIADNRISFGSNGDGVPRRKTFLSEVQQGSVSKTIWFRDEVGDNQEAKREIKSLDFDEVFSTPKPERLLQRILQLATREGDLVLDFFMGSATTAAVALKMRRRFIGIEQMNYIDTVSIPRLRRVVDGDQSGISAAVDWKGGGSFVYCELARLNRKFIDEIECATEPAELGKILEQILRAGYIDWRVEPSAIDRAEFSALSIDDQKRLLMELLDKNMLCVNRSDLDDEEFAIDDDSKSFTRNFYDTEAIADV